MKTASMLVNPTEYYNAFKVGENDAANKKPRSNPYYNGVDSTEKFDGYEDGYEQFANHHGYYVEFSHDGKTIERRYFKLSTSAISFASGIEGAQVKIKE